MGNFISCRNLSTPITTTRASCRPATRVILPGGQIRLFRDPFLKAAEIMLESPPNYFLADSKSLLVGKRFSPLPADQDLEFGHVYILFPMKRLKSVVTAADVTLAVLMTANTMSSRRISSGTKVKPVAAAAAATTVDSNCVKDNNEAERSSLSLEEIQGFNGTEYRFKISACRSRKPLLDTIAEEPLSFR